MEVSTTYFHIFRKFGANFPKKLANSLKSSKIGITPVKTTEILRNSEKNRRKFDENLQNLPSLSKINKNCAEFCKNGAKVLKNHRNLEWCKGKNVDLVKSFHCLFYHFLLCFFCFVPFSQFHFPMKTAIPTSIYFQRFVSIQPRTSLSKFAKKSPKVRNKLETS